MTNGLETAFLELVHEVYLGGQLSADAEVVQGIKTALENIVNYWFSQCIGMEKTLVALQVPPLGKVDVGVPVD